MSKLLLLTTLILSLLLFVISVNAEPGFNIIEDFANITTSSATTISGSFNVNNTGTTDLNLNFSGYTLTKDTHVVTIALNNITNLANGTMQAVTFSVEIPKQQSHGLYSGTLNAKSNASNTDAITIKINVTPTYDISTLSELNLGTVKLNSTHTKTFNLTNTGNANLTNVSFSFSNADFKLKTNNTNFILQFNKTEAIEFNLTIAEEFSTGNVTLGTVRISSTEIIKDLFSIRANVGGGLIIDDLDVFLTTRKSKNEDHFDVQDGESLNFGDEDADPGSELRFKFNIENTFTDEENVDINNILVKIIIEGIDDGEDIEEESEEVDLEDEESQEVNVIVKIPLAVEEGSYDVSIAVEGEDDKGNEHKEDMKVELEINKELRDIVIATGSLFPQKIVCSGTATLSTTIKNIGQKIEDDVKLEIVNDELGVGFVQSDIKLDEAPFDADSEFTKEIKIIPSKNTATGAYPIEIKAYLIEGAVWETKSINLEFEGCPLDIKTEVKEDEEDMERISEEEFIEQEEGIDEKNAEEIPILKPETTKELSLTKRPAFWIAIISVNIIVVAAVIFLVVSIVKKK